MVLVPGQATLLLQANRKFAWHGPGIAETIFKSESDGLISWLIESGPKDIFIGKDVMYENETLGLFSPWLSGNLRGLSSSYVFSNENDRLTHMVRIQ